MKPWTIALGVVAIVGAGVAVPIAAGRPELDPTFKTLHRPHSTGDRLPARSSGPLAAVDPSSARKVGRIDGHDVYLAPGPDGGLCILDVEGGGVGGACSPRGAMKDRPMYSAWRDGESTTATVVVAVPDQYEHATVAGDEVPVNNNVALTHAHLGKSTIELSGEQGTVEGELGL